MVLRHPGSYAYCLQGFYEKRIQDIALEIFSVCISKSVHLEMEWIPRAENGLANYYCRIEDYDDLGISFHLLNLIQNRLSTLSIDWFASDHNAKCEAAFLSFLE